MPTLCHLSDLHFGRHFDRNLGDLILRQIDTLNPDAVVISGDFTYRGRHNEYLAAAEYVGRISRPLLRIPGNHDMPLYEPFERLTSPYRRYQKYIWQTVDASLSSDELFILGLSDCHPIMPGGFWSREQRAWIRQKLLAAPTSAIKVVVSHHQFAWDGKWRPVGFWNAESAVEWLSQQGVELILNGHTHIPEVVQLQGGMVVVRAGTATSKRLRSGWANTFNIIKIAEQEVFASICRYDADSGTFVTGKEYRFHRRNK